MALLSGGRDKVDVALSFEHSTRYLAVDLAIEGNTPAAKGKGRRVALEFEVIDGYNAPTRHEGAQLLIESIGVTGTLGVGHCRAIQEKKEDCKDKDASSQLHRRASENMFFLWHNYSAWPGILL